MSFDDFWKNFLTSIEEKTSAQIVETWFKPLSLNHFSPETVSIEVPNKFFLDWINENYKSLIRETIHEITSLRPDLKFVIASPFNSKNNEPAINKPPPQLSKKNNSVPENINPLYTFSNFVVGSSNQFAHAACKAVADRPGGTYNPLFIYGGVGLGKTHLMHAIVHNCLNMNQDLKVLYLTSEKFTNEMINSIRHEKMSSFRKKYRNIDVLLLDDIQFIAGKERTQEEFFHTFNDLFDFKKQIVLTSDKPPREIDSLEERLRTRFEWGLIADIQPPDTETKVAILEKKALSNRIVLPNEVAFMLADSVKSNIRELEGLLTRLSAYSSLYGCDISVDFTKEVLKDFITIANNEALPEDIQKAVCKHFNIKLSDLKGKKKNNSIVLPRQISMYIIRKRTKLSFPEIGDCFGGRDHSTVIYSIKKVESLMNEDKSVKEAVDLLFKKV